MLDIVGVVAVMHVVSFLQALQEPRRCLRETLQRHRHVLLPDHERAHQRLGGVLQVFQGNLQPHGGNVTETHACSVFCS